MGTGVSGSDDEVILEAADSAERPDPTRQDKELRASITELGQIDCSCGWEGEAASARINGAGWRRQIFCPQCRRRLFQVFVDE